MGQRPLGVSRLRQETRRGLFHDHPRLSSRHLQRVHAAGADEDRQLALGEEVEPLRRPEERSSRAERDHHRAADREEGDLRTPGGRVENLAFPRRSGIVGDPDRRARFSAEQERRRAVLLQLEPRDPRRVGLRRRPPGDLDPMPPRLRRERRLPHLPLFALHRQARDEDPVEGDAQSLRARVFGAHQHPQRGARRGADEGRAARGIERDVGGAKLRVVAGRRERGGVPRELSRREATTERHEGEPRRAAVDLGGGARLQLRARGVGHAQRIGARRPGERDHRHPLVEVQLLLEEDVGSDLRDDPLDCRHVRAPRGEMHHRRVGVPPFSSAARAGEEEEREDREPRSATSTSLHRSDRISSQTWS